MDVFISRHRITYTPLDGEALLLLSPLDLEAAEPSFDGGPETQVEAGILSAWASHHSRGNANVSLSFDRYVPAPCLEQAQARGLELWRYLNEHAEGCLLFETAFMGQVSEPLVQWKLHATISRVELRELDVDSSPFAGPGYHVRFQFMISFPPSENNGE